MRDKSSTQKIISYVIIIVVGTMKLQAGVLEQLFYDGVFNANGGRTVSVADLRNADIFPESPTDFLPLDLESGLSTPRGQGEDFGSMVRGFIQAPLTGSYTFAIASDDSSEFLLSTDADPANLVLLGEETDCCTALFSGPRLDARTGSVELTRGVIYYFEAIYKEGGNDDWMDVGWILPDGTQAIIPVEFLFPATLGGVDVAGAPLFDIQPLDVFTDEGGSASFTAHVSGSQPMTIQWQKNGLDIPNATLAAYAIDRVSVSDDTAVFSVDVTNAQGSTSSFGAVLFINPDVTPPEIRSVDARGNPNGISIIFSEEVSEAEALNPSSYEIDGGSVGIADIMLSGNRVINHVGEPGATRVTITIEGAPFDEGSTHSIQISGIRDRAITPNTIATITGSFTLGGGFTTAWDFTNGLPPGDAAAKLLFIEAEDFDFDGGRWIQDEAIGMDGQYTGSSYDGLGGIQGIDFSGAGSTRSYRATGDPGPSVDKLSSPGDIRNDRGTFEVEFNWILGWNDAGDWTNYTRDFPAGEYNVAGSFSSGGSDTLVQLDRVISGQKTDNQVLEKLGEFNGAATGNWDTFSFIQLTDDDLNAATISLAGLSTLRVTTLPGNMDMNFLAFLPISTATGTVEITPEGQPTNQTALENAPAGFRVSPGGAGPFAYQWFFNNEPIAGAQRNTFSIASASSDTEGVYRVEVLNEFSLVLSDTANLILVKDADSPRPVSAVGSISRESVTVEFNEPLDADSAGAASNYVLTQLSNGSRLSVIDASLNNATTVLLTTEVQAGAADYRITINGVKDVSQNGNPTVDATIDFMAEPELDFGSSVLFIEAEDFDFDGGEWVRDVAIGMNGPYAGNAYDGLSGIQNIDFSGAGSTRSYRTTGDPGPSVDKLSSPGDVRNIRGDFEVESNWILGWNDPGDWTNYTRDFPTGVYQVFGSFSSGGNETHVQLDVVLSGQGTENQTLEKLGDFIGPATGNWDVFADIPLTDEDGSLAAITLFGINTLRVTTLPGNMDLNYLHFVPLVTEPGPGPVDEEAAISIQSDGDDNIVLTYTGILWVADDVEGPYAQNMGASSPMVLPPNQIRRFYQASK